MWSRCGVGDVKPDVESLHKCLHVICASFFESALKKSALRIEKCVALSQTRFNHVREMCCLPLVVAFSS